MVTAASICQSGTGLSQLGANMISLAAAHSRAIFPRREPTAFGQRHISSLSHRRLCFLNSSVQNSCHGRGEPSGHQVAVKCAPSAVFPRTKLARVSSAIRCGRAHVIVSVIAAALLCCCAMAAAPFTRYMRTESPASEERPASA
jgi:hypothetical protein